jgi:uncharacterized membrane protein YidH (DUF202 family)
VKGRKIWAIGGLASGGLLILFGIAALVLGISSYNLVQDQLSQEKIVGTDDMTPDAIAKEAQDAGLPADTPLPDCDVAGEPIDTGKEAYCFAQYMRVHALEGTGGLTYAEMGRYQSASDPADPKGTNDPDAAAKDENGQPVSNGQRNLWVTETALATALNVSYMGEQTSLFGIVVGIALVLVGIGLIILAYVLFVRKEKAAPAGAPEPV